MTFDYVYQLNQQHQQELHRQAQQRRLARAAQQRRPHVALNMLGRQMVNLGEKLQAMAETEPQPAVLQPETR